MKVESFRKFIFWAILFLILLIFWRKYRSRRPIESFELVGTYYDKEQGAERQLIISPLMRFRILEIAGRDTFEFYGNYVLFMENYMMLYSDNGSPKFNADAQYHRDWVSGQIVIDYGYFPGFIKKSNNYN